MKKLLLAAVIAAASLAFSVAVAQTPLMVPSLCVGTFALAQPMIRGGGAMVSCATSGGAPPACTNSLDLSKACNSANLDLL